MLSGVDIENFQAHKKLSLSFKPGVNSIVGPTDVGKSAIIRALWWACRNGLSGDGFIREGAKQARVTVAVDGLGGITRARGGKDGNLYQMEGKDYVSFASGVPDEVREVLAMDDLNFQLQFDAPFWFGSSASEVSRQLNAIVNLGLIDEALSEVAGKLRQARTQVQVLEETTKQAKKRFTELEHVPAMEEQLARIEELETRVNKVQSRASRLKELIEEAKQHARRRREESEALDALQPALQAGKAALSAQTRRQEAAAQTASLRRSLERLRSARAVLEAGVPDIAPLLQIQSRLAEAGKRRRRLSDLIVDARDGFQEVRQRKAKLDEARAELAPFSGQVCPVCLGRGKLVFHEH